MKEYPFSDWVHGWLDRVGLGISSALDGDSAMSDVVSGHFGGVHGKRLRPALAILTAAALGGVTEDAVNLAVGIELVHMATLVHDDVVDGAATRRGVATPNAKWGTDSAILVGDFIFSRSFTVLASLRNTEVIASLARAVSLMCEGEWDQLKDRFDLHVTIDEYCARISGKTAAFMGCCCECGALLSGASPETVQDFYSYGYGLGMAFQIVDDLLDYRGDPDLMGKPVTEDLASGVYTLPLIIAMQDDTGSELSELLAVSASDVDARRRLVSAVKASGAVERSMDMARGYVNEALDSLGSLPDSEAKSMLTKLAAFVCDREY